MKRIFLLLTVVTLLYSPLFAAGKVYWQANGVLITDRDGMVAISPVPDGNGGVIVFGGDGMDSLFAIKIDEDGNLPWTLHGKVLDDDGFGGSQGSVRAVSDGKGGAVAVWVRFYPWGYNLYYNRIDSLGNKVWAGNGIPLTLSDSSQEYHQTVSDGAGGAIAAWQEQRNGQWDIYAQRVDSNGLRQWGDYGVLIVTNVNQAIPAIVTNMKQGLLVGWSDYSSGSWDIYIQQLDSLGNLKWGTNGTNVCNADSGQFVYDKALTTDSMGGGGVIVWTDKRNIDYDVYAQRIDSNGMVKLQVNGVPVCTTNGNQYEPVIIESDCKGGGVILWGDYRASAYRDIYIQRIDKNGNMMWLNNGCAVCTAGYDQRNPKIVNDNFSGALITWQDKRSGNYDIYAQHVDSSGNMKWQTDGMAICTTTYDQVYPEMAPSDSNTAIIIWSDGRSGYYRGYAQRVGDDPDGVEGRPTTELQIVNCKLHQNYPNPFKTKTTISYQLTTNGQVNLSIYNIAGQLVRTLTPPNPPLEGRDKREGSVTWDGRDNKGRQVSNGVYFYRLRVNEDITKTNKMVKIK